jgi:hypothetical protein
MEMADEAADYEKYREEVITTLVGLGYGIFTDAVQYAGTVRKTNKGGVPVGDVGNVGPRISAGSKLPNEARSLIDTTLSRGGMGSPKGSLQKCENEWRRRGSRSGPSDSTGRS